MVRKRWWWWNTQNRAVEKMWRYSLQVQKKFTWGFELVHIDMNNIHVYKSILYYDLIIYDNIPICCYNLQKTYSIPHIFSSDNSSTPIYRPAHSSRTDKKVLVLRVSDISYYSWTERSNGFLSVTTKTRTFLIYETHSPSIQVYHYGARAIRLVNEA